VRAVPAGHAVEWDARVGAPRARRAWHPPPFDEHSRVPFAAAAEALRHTLARAVGERSAGGGEPTTVWLSGGYDSTAVLAAAGDHAARVHADTGVHDPGPVRAVSISYPPGDSGREDETIAAVAAHVGVPVHWIDVRGIPMLDGLAQRAARWDEPLAHPFERWNEALAAGSCAAGARVALNGHGGDQLFSASKGYLSDLLAAGQLAVLASEWRARRLGRARAAAAAWRWILRPRLPEWVARAAAHAGRPLGHYLERPLPPWAGPRAALAHEAAAARWPERRRARGQTAAAFEAEWYLTHPYIASMAEAVASRALATGVSLRFPLYDARVIALAAGRPRAERAAMGESKRLLRRAVEGALPPEVLAPRPYRTGTTTTYWRSAVRTCGAALFAAAFADPVLAGLGIVDPVRLRAEAARLVAGSDERHAAALLATLRAELWLRARTRAVGGAEAD
jgi:asparagine synthase (glutamine-hydrolysing)